MDVVSLFSAAGHSPACFWIGGFESDSENVVFSWNISAKAMDKYFIEWESGYPKNRWALPRLAALQSCCSAHRCLLLTHCISL